MDYKDLIERRKNYFVFSDEVVDEKIIKEVFEEVYYHAPSQNLLFPYEVSLYRNDNYENKVKLLELTHRNSNLSVEDDPGNPQVLAPWLIGLTYKERHNVNTAIKDRNPCELELGILLTYISLGLQDRGVDTAFCKCIRDNEKLGEIFGTNRIDVIIAVGIGTSNSTFKDLRTNTIKNVPYDINLVHSSRYNKKANGLFKEIFKNENKWTDR